MRSVKSSKLGVLLSGVANRLICKLFSIFSLLRKAALIKLISLYTIKDHSLSEILIEPSFS